MNSMHNSFNGPGSYSGPYPGYVPPPPPPSGLPYFNGYPGELSQASAPYYGKPVSSVPPGYSPGMPAYTSSMNNSSMYYQQYGLSYQYGYGKYGLGSSLPYPSDHPPGTVVHPPSLAALQAPTSDLGLTGSMFSKNSKFSGQNCSTLQPSNINHGPMHSPSTSNTPSPGPHMISGNLKGSGATPSPPVDPNDAKKDLEKMKRCQVCGQVFRLMSECLAHMKAVHEAPLSVYNLQHSSSGQVNQSITSSSLPPQSLTGRLPIPTSRHASHSGAPDNPLMALERMGWGEKQNTISPMQSSSPLTYSSPTLPPTSVPGLSVPHSLQNIMNQPRASTPPYSSRSGMISGQHSSSFNSTSIQHPQLGKMASSSLQHTANFQSSISPNQSSPTSSEANLLQNSFSQASIVPSVSNSESLSLTQNVTDETEHLATKQRKAHSYSVSSIIGESKDNTPMDNKDDKLKKTEETLIKESSNGENDLMGSDQKQAIEISSHSGNNEKSGITLKDENKNENEILIPESTITKIENKNDTHGERSKEHGSFEEQNIYLNNKILTPEQQECSDMQNIVDVSDGKHCHDVSRITTRGGEIDSDSNYSTDNISEHDDKVNSNSHCVDVKQEDSSMNSEKSECIVENLSKSEGDNKNDKDVTKPADIDIDVNSPGNQSYEDEKLTRENNKEKIVVDNQTSQPPISVQSPNNSHAQVSQSSATGPFTNPNGMKPPTSYGSWPMNVTNFSNQYTYPQANMSQHQLHSTNVSGAVMCSKPHGPGYSMSPRYSSQYHQPGPGNSNTRTFLHDPHIRGPGPHNYVHSRTQVHPQGNWISSPRADSKPLWGNWSNQNSQPYPHGYFGYTGPSHSSPQKQHPQHSPPANMHPPQSQHMHNIQLSNMNLSPQNQHSKSQHFQPQNVNVSQQQLISPCTRSVSSISSYDPQNKVGKSSSKPHEDMDENFTPNSVSLSTNASSTPDTPLQNNSNPNYFESEDLRSLEDNVIEKDDSQKTVICPSSHTGLKKLGHKIGPKSKMLNLQLQEETINELNESESSNGHVSQNNSNQSCDSSDNESVIDDTPKLTLLKSAKRKHGVKKGIIFMGPKRIKLAKQVQERQVRRQRYLEEQIRQTEIEEQMMAQRIEATLDTNGPLAKVILQSSILLTHNKVEESDTVEECIASIKAEHNPSFESQTDDNNSSLLHNIHTNNGYEYPTRNKPGRKTQIKIFHNENSVRITDLPNIEPLRKLRAKDFKWSHYVKTTRYWCNDCGQGFKYSKEASSHTEEKCKLNCLYMLECYVVVNDIQTHPVYGGKVQDLLEEYQIDAQHQCRTCFEIIARKADYLVHVDSHKDFMPWECTICGSRFKIRGSLKEHLRYTHMKGRVPCLKCSKVFPTSTLLRQHVKVHTQHYKYKSAKNREEELRAAMEATAGALDVSMGATSSYEDNEKLSQEANEYRNWCRLMERNALKNLSTPGSSGGSGALMGEEEEEDARGDMGSNEEGMRQNIAGEERCYSRNSDSNS